MDNDMPETPPIPASLQGFADAMTGLGQALTDFAEHMTMSGLFVQACRGDSDGVLRALEVLDAGQRERLRAACGLLSVQLSRVERRLMERAMAAEAGEARKMAAGA